MRGSRTLATLALTAAWAVSSWGQEPPAEPITGVPGVPTASGVVDLRQPPEAALAPLAPEQAESIHSPLPPPPDRAGAVPETALAPRAAAPAAALGPLGPSPAITQGFEALPDSGTVIPPDTYGAVGPSHLMVTLNSQVRVSNRNGTPLVLDRTLNGFWGATGGGGGTFDPRSFYDPYADRWVLVSCDDARLASSAILIGASQTGDPTGLWDLHRVDADSGDTLWADYPSVGFNRKWVVVQVNMFTITTPHTFVRSHIYVFERAALYAGSAPFTLIQDPSGFTQAPALTYDMTVNDLALVEEWSAGLGQLRLLKISGSVGSESLSVVGTPTGTPWVFAPPVADFAPQDDPPLFRKIATNDARIQNVVFRNGKLWTTHTVFLPAPGPAGRASVQWWQIDPATAGVLQRGRIDDPTGTNFYAFPSIAVNKFDDALLGFSCFAQTRFASACYAFRKASDAPSTFQDVATLKPGLASYYKTFFGTVNRWGDYSATVVDPVNDVDLWTIQEYAMQLANSWGTWWGHLALAPEIRINDVSLAEGDSGTTNARFTVSLSFPSTQTVEVDWAAADGSATQLDADFLAAGGHLTFPPGTVSLTVNVPVVGDLKLETDESFVVNLTTAVNATIADAQGVGTILNDDGLPTLSIEDVRVVEGDAGTTTATFTVTLSSPSSVTAQAAWSTSNGTALAPGDYLTSSGTVVFVAGDTSETLTVQVVGDFVAEPIETFHVDLTAPVNAVLGKSRGVGTILDNDGTANPGVSFLTVVSDGGTLAASGHNRLQWVNPAGGSPIEMRIRWNRGLGCAPPTDPAGPSTGVISWAPIAPPGSLDSFDHNGLDLDTSYCYTVWVIHVGPVASAGASVIGRPFNATGKLKWKYATSTTVTGVAPPTVAQEGVFAVDNSGHLHAMSRSGGGGEWPPGPPPWYPANLGAPSQARNPIVPLSLGTRAFISTQDGRVHAVDTKTGAVAWATALSPPAVTAAPAGIFSAFGGEHDAILVGTSASDDNVFHALEPATGAPLTSYGPPTAPGIGPISGMAVVDYSRAPQNRVYFASRQGTRPETLWCLELGPAGPLGFSLKWRVNVGNISGSPVLRGDRIYVGTDAGEVKSVRADNGGDVRTTGPLGDGPIKGFVFPDRASGDVYVSTTTKVWRLTDTGAPLLTTLWGVPLPNPSIPLLWPGTTHVFVGGDDGRLYQLDTASGATRSIALDYDPLAFEVGAPSLDLGFDIVHVGSVRGVFYAVQVPLP